MRHRSTLLFIIGCFLQMNVVLAQSAATCPAPVISTQKQITCVGQPVVLKATGCEGTVVWSNQKQGSTLTVSPDKTTTYTAHCELNGCKSAASNALTITVNLPATPTVKASKTSICYGEAVTLTVSGCTGEVIWSNNQIGKEITVTPIATTAYTATCRQEGCVSCFADEIIIKVLNNRPTITATSTRICEGESIGLSVNASTCGGTLRWSTGATGSSINMTPTSSQTYSATCETATCTPLTGSINVSVAPPAPPVVKASRTAICEGESVLLTAENCVGKVKWSHGAEGNEVRVSPSKSETYTAICVLPNCQSGASTLLSITVEGAVPAAPTVISTLTNQCPFQTVDLSSAIQNKQLGMVYEARLRNTPDAPLVESVGGVDKSGNYFIFARNAQGCYSGGSLVKITLTPCDNGIVPCLTNPATATISKVEKTTSGNYFVQGQVGGVAKTGQWNSNGTGSFSNINGLNTIYTPSDEDRKAGKVTLAFSTEDPDGAGPCTAATTTQALAVESLVEKPKEMVGLSKIVTNFKKISNRQFEVTYRLTVTNMGSNDLAEVLLTDSLDKTFKNGSIIVGKPKVRVFVRNSTLENTEMRDSTFTGKSGHYDLLVPEYAYLGKGEMIQVDLTVTVDASQSSDTIFYNRAYVRALDANNNICEDWSHNAETPDANGNGNPNDDQAPTPISVNGQGGSITPDLFIPEGFSPNGDGVNDAFVIRKSATLKVSIEIYNRLGGMVYRNDDYKNDWKGEGINQVPLPAGTYFYVVKTNDGREFSRFLTLGR